VAAFDEHAAYLRSSGAWQSREQERIQNNLQNLIQSTLVARWQKQVPPEHYQAGAAAFVPP
jgi:hypothetical protein